MVHVKAGFVKGGLVAIVAAALTGGALVAFGSQQNSPPGASPPAPTHRLAAGGTRTSEGGRVSVAVSWDGLAQSQGSQVTLVLQVAMDTHSVNLDTYDLAKLAVLRNDRGETAQPASWQAPRGGHHRKGELSFAVPATFLAGARFLDVVVRDIAGVPERVLRWELGVAS